MLEAEACPNHIHILIEIPLKYSAAEFMGYLKSKSTLMIFEKHANMKYKFGNRKIWAIGYFIDTVGKNEIVIRQYIQSQLAEDKLADELNLKEYIDSFTGEKVKTSDLPSLLEAACESIASSGSSVIEGPSQQHALVVLLIPLIFISGNDTFI